MTDGVQTYKLGDFDLKLGGKIPNAHVAFKTFGDPKLPAIIYPSWYSGSQRCENMILLASLTSFKQLRTMSGS